VAVPLDRRLGSQKKNRSLHWRPYGLLLHVSGYSDRLGFVSGSWSSDILPCLACLSLLIVEHLISKHLPSVSYLCFFKWTVFFLERPARSIHWSSALTYIRYYDLIPKHGCPDVKQTCSSPSNHVFGVRSLPADDTTRDSSRRMPWLGSQPQCIQLIDLFK